MAKVSVLLPCYKAERWLADALDSVIRQTARDIEILVYDDGSADRTPYILDGYARRDRRVRIFGGEANRGIVHALNFLLDHADGDYVARMDADDVSLPHRFETQLAFLADTGVDLCGSWFQEFGCGLPRTVRWVHEESAVRVAMLFQNTICHPTLLARRDVFGDFRYRRSHSLAEDYDLFARAGTRFRLANVPRVLLRYRRHRAQETQARRSAMEHVTRSIRADALIAAGVDASPADLHIHNMIRAPQSIRDPDYLERIEAWLIRLAELQDDERAQHVVASQWIRACIRAAPLGFNMLKRYRRSPLRVMGGGGAGVDADLTLLALTKLDYLSPPFELLRRFRLSA